MFRRGVGVAATLLVLSASVWAYGGDAAKKDQEAMQGTWKVSKAVINGQPAMDDLIKKIAVIIDKDKLTMKLDGNVFGDGTFKLDPSKSPKQIDMTTQSGPDKGQVRLGIYEIDGNKLKIHFKQGPEALKERPKDFSGDHILLEREKK
jgi:uncharacterized protein (TIGR03067 family)